ncbi:MAG TPA: DUF6282 family protein [Terriglobales bacterium]|nr:DUF6282 family protein [Terriglobales bacterium]
MKKAASKPWLRGLLATLLLAALGMFSLVRAQSGPAVEGGASGAAKAPGSRTAQNAQGLDDYASVSPLRGPVDLALSDPALIGAIDVHEHLDPDAPGTNNQVRSIDAMDEAVLARARGLRGFVIKTHQNAGSAGMAYLMRQHVTPELAIFGRMALNFSSGGINVAAVHHFVNIKGGWGRIVEMPTVDSLVSTRDETPERMAASRPWMLFTPPGFPKYVPTVRNGELLPEVKYLIQEMAKMRTVDSNGRLILATGHATPEEHLLLAREGRARGLQVLITHSQLLSIPQMQEVAKLGAFLELTSFDLARANARQMLHSNAEKIRAVGAESFVIGSDCGQTGNPLPIDCLAMIAKGLRAEGITEPEIDLIFKDNAARLLGLPARVSPARGLPEGLPSEPKSKNE